jgi:small-conductance mechanosensitive channel
VRSELNETIWWAFKSAGVTIAFPQLDVHFDPPIADSLHALAAH